MANTRRTPARRSDGRAGLKTGARRSAPRRQRRSPALRIAVSAAVLFAGVVLWAAVARQMAARANTTRSSFDVLIVLGTPTDSDGNPTPTMLDRVSEGVREYEHGVAPHIVFTGAAAHNRYVEADAMGRVARAQGVPASAILEEAQALDTIQNACYSARIASAHGWHSAEIISSAPHLPRAAMIFAHLPPQLSLQWRVHAAPDNLTPGSESSAATPVEILKTVRYLLWARWTEACTP